MHNDINLVGRPTAALTVDMLKRSANGTAILNFSIAQTRGKNTTNPVAQFFDVTAFGSLAENIVKSGITTKDVLMIVGRLDFRTWQTPEGAKRNAVSTIANFVGPDMTYATVSTERNAMPTAEQGDPGVQVPGDGEETEVL